MHTPPLANMHAPCGLGPPNLTKIWPTGLTFWISCYLEITFFKYLGLNPPPLNVILYNLTRIVLGIVYIVHDLGGHCLLYDVIATRFLDEGYTVATHDHHGHGLSSGTRLHTSSYKVAISDGCVFRSTARRARKYL